MMNYWSKYRPTSLAKASGVHMLYHLTAQRILLGSLVVTSLLAAIPVANSSRGPWYQPTNSQPIPSMYPFLPRQSASFGQNYSAFFCTCLDLTTLEYTTLPHSYPVHEYHHTSTCMIVVPIPKLLYTYCHVIALHTGKSLR